MSNLIAVAIGFLASFFGLLAPSMLNMTTARISMERGRSAGIRFASGAAAIVFIQGYIALYFAKYLVANPSVILNLKRTGIVILVGLSIFFFVQARSKLKIRGKQKTGSYFATGLGMSSLNMLAIPFYLAVASLAENKGWMKIEPPYLLSFVSGAVLGSFSLFTIYAVFAEIIAGKVEFIAKNMNYILSVLFLVLAGFTVFSLTR